MRLIAKTLLAVLALVTTATAFATGARAASANAQDMSYLKTDAQANLTEIAAAKLAQARSQTAATRRVAARILTDHTNAQKQLGVIAGKLGVTLPSKPSPAQQDQLAQLQATPAKDFDLTYLRIQVNDHTTAIADARAEAKKGEYSALTYYAKSVLPTLLLHRRLANAALVEIQGHAAATAPPTNASPAPDVVVTNGPEAFGAKKPHSDDGPWLWALLGVILLVLLAGGLYLRRAVRPRRNL